MVSLKWGGLFLAVALAGCKAAGPPVPAEDFAFKAQNEITQAGVDGSGAQVAVRFTVSLPGDLDPTDLGKIQSVDVLWPNNYIRTPILSGFQAEGDSLTATQLLSDHTEGLFQGIYTLEVTFGNGQTVTQARMCDGRILPAPTITLLQIDSTGGSMHWQSPAVFHTWKIYLERLDPPPTTVVVSGLNGTGNGGSVGIGFDYAFQPDETYSLVMEMENACNHRVIRVPVP